jgi:hypothetical protein
MLPPLLENDALFLEIWSPRAAALNNERYAVGDDGENERS